jgi:hypothetical protein
MSILRTTSVSESLKNQSDITYSFVPWGIWTLVEANLGIITSCLIVLKKPMSQILRDAVLSLRKIRYAACLERKTKEVDEEYAIGVKDSSKPQVEEHDSPGPRHHG